MCTNVAYFIISAAKSRLNKTKNVIKA